MEWTLEFLASAKEMIAVILKLDTVLVSVVVYQLSIAMQGATAHDREKHCDCSTDHFTI
jgi:hypothetical protein